MAQGCQGRQVLSFKIQPLSLQLQTSGHLTSKCLRGIGFADGPEVKGLSGQTCARFQGDKAETLTLSPLITQRNTELPLKSI